jgi:hypothetical protein
MRTTAIVKLNRARREMSVQDFIGPHIILNSTKRCFMLEPAPQTINDSVCAETL